MGLSRNKVAVSEGAAGSPPFYGDRETESAGRSRDLIVELGKNLDREMCIRLVRIDSVVQLSGFNQSLRENTQIWGCSSVGRAPALQAGGHGFESHHLHQSAVPTAKTRGCSEGNPKFIPDGKESLSSKQGTQVIHTHG